MFGSRKLRSWDHEELATVVAPFDPRTRRALYAACNAHVLRRGTWGGCALHRAGQFLGHEITTLHEAERAFGTDHQTVVDFVKTWDRLRCSDQQRTILLRRAILTLGLFADESQTADAHEVDVASAERFTSAP